MSDFSEAVVANALNEISRLRQTAHEPRSLEEDARLILERLSAALEADRSETAGDPRFHALLREIGALHDRKQEDYGTNGDPFKNVRAAADFGVPAWIGAVIRMNDKMIRLQKFAQRGSLANESVEDSFLDIATYALIALVLYREAHVVASAERTLERVVHTVAVKDGSNVNDVMQRIGGQKPETVSDENGNTNPGSYPPAVSKPDVEED